MISFKAFITESRILQEALTGSLENLSNKDAIRNQIIKITGLDAAKVQKYFTNATDSNAKKAYTAFVEAFPKEAKSINNMRADGVGPGETLFYFIFDNVAIGGRNSPIDLYKDGKPWAEVKAGRLGPGPGAISNFKIMKDNDKASVQLFKDLKNFNDKYLDITGEDLPGWDSPASSATSAINSWRSIDLEELAKGVKSGKKPIDLVLKKDGDVLVKGDSDPITNVTKTKTVKPIADLISSTSGVQLTAEDKKISTLDKIIQRWAEAAVAGYLKDKKLALVDSKTGKLVFFGELKPEQIDLLVTNRNQPWAKVYYDGVRPKTAAKSEPKTETKQKSSGEELGKALKKK